MKKQSSDYRSCFRRPLWTPDTRRFWGILIILSFVSVSLNLQFISWSGSISSSKISEKIKITYNTYLADHIAAPPLSKTPETATAKDFLMNSESFIRHIQPPAVVEKSSAGRSENNPRIIDHPDEISGEISEDVAETDEIMLSAITSAVESVAGYAGTRSTGGRMEKALRLYTGRKLFRSENGQINLPIPEVFHFASLNGNRDLHETSAILEMNEADLKYCFEKIARYNPSFSASILIKFTIHPEGFVIPGSIEILNSNIKDPTMIECIRLQIERWRNFTRIAYEDGNFTVTRKYVF